MTPLTLYHGFLLDLLPLVGVFFLPLDELLCGFVIVVMGGPIDDGESVIFLLEFVDTGVWGRLLSALPTLRLDRTSAGDEYEWRSASVRLFIIGVPSFSRLSCEEIELIDLVAADAPSLVIVGSLVEPEWDEDDDEDIIDEVMIDDETAAVPLTTESTRGDELVVVAAVFEPSFAVFGETAWAVSFEADMIMEVGELDEEADCCIVGDVIISLTVDDLFGFEFILLDDVDIVVLPVFGLADTRRLFKVDDDDCGGVEESARLSTVDGLSSCSWTRSSSMSIGDVDSDGCVGGVGGGSGPLQSLSTSNSLLSSWLVSFWLLFLIPNTEDVDDDFSLLFIETIYFCLKIIFEKWFREYSRKINKVFVKRYLIVFFLSII